KRRATPRRGAPSFKNSFRRSIEVPRLLNQPITVSVVLEQRCYLLMAGPHPPANPPRGGRDQGAQRSRRAGKHGVHAVLLRGSRGQSVDQSGARSVREDSRIQVLRGAGRTRRGAQRGGV